MIPNGFICPITQQIFNDPVVGNIYEKSAWMEWFNERNTSPLTNIKMSNIVYPIHFMRTLIDNLLIENPHLVNQQYNSKSHRKHVNEISTIIKNRQFNQLLDYYDYDYQILRNEKVIFTTGYSEMKKSLTYYLFRF